MRQDDIIKMYILDGNIYIVQEFVDGSSAKISLSKEQFEQFKYQLKFIETEMIEEVKDGHDNTIIM